MTAFQTSDGAITVDVPAGPDWNVESVAGVVQGETRASLVKCKRTAPGEFFFLLAKDYSVPASQVVSPEKLLREVYPRIYAGSFQQVKLDIVSSKVIDGREWWEAGFQLLHARLGPIAKLERVACVGEHVLLVSGEGSPKDVRTHFPVLGAWMAGARFASGA